MSLILSEIYIYPIKSLGGIRLKTAQVEEKGLQYDRRWMLIDENNQFITQRKHYKMALINTTLEDNHIVVNTNLKNLPPLKLPTNLANPATFKVNVWKDTTEAAEVSKEANDWFSEALDMNCRLVNMPETANRPIKKEWAINDENVSFADGYPYLIIGQSSLDDLNKRLEKPVPVNRFRPNLVFTGGEPYEEDNWSSYFSIGNVKFKGLKPCVRCVLTTIDQKTGQKGKEPLQTLSKYRVNNKGVIFGQHAIVMQKGTITEGDTIIRTV